jgi:hypothetical protein
MSGRLATGNSCFDGGETLEALRDNIAKADAFITAAEELVESAGCLSCDDDDADLARQRNHVAHLIESAKLAVRAAICGAIDLDKHRPGT